MAEKQLSTKSSATVHIFSTLANPQKFTVYDMPDASDANQMGRLPVMNREVLIRGGAGIASKNLITPSGVHTAISRDDYDAISGLASFKQFVDAGFIRVEGKQHDIDKMIGDMNPRDVSGPLTPADFEAAPKDGSSPVPTDHEQLGTGWVANQLSNRK